MKCDFGWGADAVTEAAAAGEIVVIVDVLSFSTMAVTAIESGFAIFPFASHSQALELAYAHEVEVAVRRSEVPALGRFSLSPRTFYRAERPGGVAVFSPNGATCCRNSEGAAAVLIGCLRNAGSIAKHAQKLAADLNRSITVVACGEREADEDGREYLRNAEEDILGAGAIISALDCRKIDSAKIAEYFFFDHADDLRELMRGCPSGKWLIERGFEDDVLFSGEIDTSVSVPCYDNGVIRSGIQ